MPEDRSYKRLRAKQALANGGTEMKCPECGNKTVLVYTRLQVRHVMSDVNGDISVDQPTVEECWDEGPMIGLECVECEHTGTSKEFGLDLPTEKLYVMIGPGSDGVAGEYGSIKATSPEEALRMSIDPENTTMYVPTHMQNHDKYGALPDEEVAALALRDSISYFNLAAEDDGRYTKEYTLLEIDLKTGDIEEY